MTTTADDIEQAKAQLRDEFPKWNIIRTDVGRWWANRGPLVHEDLNAETCVDADTAEDLAEKIRAVTRAR